jgi:stage V sporulation protein B
MMCILNSYAINRKLSYRQEYIRTFVMPVAAAVIMAAVTASSSYLVTYLIRKNAGDSEMIISGMNNVLRLVVGIVTGVLTYGLLTLRLGIIRENDFKALPKGTAIANMLKRIRLLR